MRWLKALFSLAITAALFWLGQFKIGILPPIGKFVDPFAGFWQNGKDLYTLPKTMDLPGLNAPVTVVWDSRQVPHVFAQNEHDLYLTQGYLVARDRLWQMEFMALAAAGRLSEIFGERTLEFDRSRRRLGMVFGAENTVKALREDETARSIMEAFTAGINAWIDRLDERELPLEYKILDYRPEPWSELKSALILKYMAWTLTGRFNELEFTRTRQELGEETIRQLYPIFPPFTDPIIPPETPWPFRPIVPAPPEKQFYPVAAARAVEADPFVPGSNNWAVAGSRTRSGHPLLAADPHLALNLPSIWYEMQLVAPDMNVYGVTIPGLPGLIFGFNENIAWGMTNAGSDVLDWYHLTFKDSTYAEYKYGDGWRKTQKRIETIQVRGKGTVQDTVIYTHYGPVAYLEYEQPFQPNIPRMAAIRWTAHDPSKELLTFYYLNKAKGYDDYRKALQYFHCPAQNIAYADVEGNVAIWHNGKFPLRWREQGRYLLDGSDPLHEWQGWVPMDQVPHVKNPPRGFISSANQAPAAPSYPYYLGWFYAPFERGARINQWLQARTELTPQDMMRLQNDNLNLRARTVLPTLLQLLAEADLTPTEKAVYDTLKMWNFEARRDLIAPIIFEYWWREFYRGVWRDDMQSEHGRLLWPRADITIELVLNHPDSPFFDDRTTEDRETLALLAQRTFKIAVQNLETDFGPPGQNWRWGKARGTDILHLAQIPGLGRMRLETNGNYAIVNATSRRAGPSWRMVVDLTPGKVRGWGVYPGGQSGNPGSPFYDNMIEAWVNGEYYELLFLKSPEESHKNIVTQTRFEVQQ